MVLFFFFFFFLFTYTFYHYWGLTRGSSRAVAGYLWKEKEKERTNICVPTSKTVCLINQYTSDWLYVGELVEERLCLSCLPRVLLLLQFACAVVVVCPNKRV